MIPAALLCVIVSGCADQQPTGPELQRAPRVARDDNVPFNKFFVAWSQNFSPGPIQTQSFALDARQNRQWGNLFVEQSLLSFASANPGRLYINADEPDQWCITPDDYARIYNEFVKLVRATDPTARVSPAGFAEPNGRCCPPGDEACQSRMHSIGYADQFYNAHVQRFGVAPTVSEWRFHDFGLAFATGDMDGWWARVDKAAAWSVSHGANMVLGAWGFHGWNESAPAYQEYLKRAMGRLMNDPRINEAVYWSREVWAGERHYLVNADGSLTPAGQTYVNPLTDIPAGVTITDSASGLAKLRWSNTTSAWATEAEFWVQAPGSNSFVYRKTALVAGPGAAQTPLAEFNAGESVKGRVRYYNDYGQAAWSPFSNAVLMESGGVPTNGKAKSRKGPLFCFLSKRIQNQPCE